MAYQETFRIETISDLRKAYRIGKYVWPGGYPTFFMCDNGDALCWDCAKHNRRDIVSDVATATDTGWRVAGLTINYEEPDLTCDHCHTLIPSAYGDG